MLHGVAIPVIHGLNGLIPRKNGTAIYGNGTRIVAFPKSETKNAPGYPIRIENSFNESKIILIGFRMSGIKKMRIQYIPSSMHTDKKTSSDLFIVLSYLLPSISIMKVTTCNLTDLSISSLYLI